MMSVTPDGLLPATSNRYLTDVFWDRVRSVTGYRREDIDTLRTTTNPIKDVTETNELSDDTTWTEKPVITQLRADLQEYISVLRTLKAENASRTQSKLQVRSYIEDSRHQSLRQREAQCRITAQSLMNRVETLTLPETGITDLVGSSVPDQDGVVPALNSTKGSSVKSAAAAPVARTSLTFDNLKDLRVSRNSISAITKLPDALRILVASSNQISHIRMPQPHDNLIFVALSNNALTDLDFISSFPKLAVADLSFNALGDVSQAVRALADHPSLEDLNLCGNPICFEEGYRRRICSACPRLAVLDGIPVSDGDRIAPPGDAEGRFATHSNATLMLQRFKDFALLLNTAGDDDGQAPQPVAGKKDVKAAATAKDAKGPTAKGAAPGGGGKGGKGDDAVAAPTITSTTKRQVSIAAHWCGAELRLDDVEAALIAMGEAEGGEQQATAGGAKGGGKAGAKGAGGKGATASAVTAAAEPNAEAPPVAKSVWALSSTARPLAREMVAPVVIEVRAIETTTTTSSSTPEPQITVNSPFPLGRFTFDFASAVAEPVLAVPEPLKLTVTSHLELDAVTVAKRKYAVTKLKSHLKDLMTQDAALDKELSDAIRALSPAAETEHSAKATTGPAAPGGKKAVAASPAKAAVPKAPSAASTVPSAVNEEILQKKEESAARKAAIDELHTRIAVEERSVNALLACSAVEATGIFILAPLPGEHVKPAAPIAADAQDNGAPAPNAKGKEKKK